MKINASLSRYESERTYIYIELRAHNLGRSEKPEIEQDFIQYFTIMKELEKWELIDVEGGVFGIDDFLVGISIAAVVAIITDWDDFKKGFMSAF